MIASVQYACATFMNATLGLYGLDLGFMNFGDSEHILGETFALFALILLVTTIINIFQTHLLAVINNVSVWWHVLGVAVIIVILVLVPDDHQSLSFVFSERINNSGFNLDDGASGLFFWFYVLPLGFLLTLVTIRLIPALVDQFGWRWAFAALAPGPLLGVLGMLRLRSLPEAVGMAGGRR